MIDDGFGTSTNDEHFANKLSNVNSSEMGDPNDSHFQTVQIVSNCDHKPIQFLENVNKKREEFMVNSLGGSKRPLKQLKIEALGELVSIFQNLSENHANIQYLKDGYYAVLNSNNPDDIQNLMKNFRYNKLIIKQYQDEIETIELKRREGINLLDELSIFYSTIHSNDQYNIEIFHQKLLCANNHSKLSEIIGKIKAAIKASENNNFRLIKEIDDWLAEPIVSSDPIKIYISTPRDFNTIKEPYCELNKFALTNINVYNMEEIVLDKPFQVSRLKSQYVLDNCQSKDFFNLYNSTDSNSNFLLGSVFKAFRWLLYKLVIVIGLLLMFSFYQFGKQVIKGKYGKVFGLYVASKVPAPFTNGSKSILEVATTGTINGVIDASKSVVKGVTQGVKNSKPTKYVFNVTNSLWQKTKHLNNKLKKKFNSLLKFETNSSFENETYSSLENETNSSLENETYSSLENETNYSLENDSNSTFENESEPLFENDCYDL